MKDTIDISKLIVTSEAARRLGVTRTRVNQLIHDGTVPAIKFGRDYLIDSDDLDGIKLPGRGRPLGGRLSPEKVKRIRSNTGTCRAVAEEEGISRQMVWLIRANKAYREAGE